MSTEDQNHSADDQIMLNLRSHVLQLQNYINLAGGLSECMLVDECGFPVEQGLYFINAYTDLMAIYAGLMEQPRS